MTRTLRNALILLLALAFAPPLLARDASSLDNAVRQAREKSNGREKISGGAGPSVALIAP